MQFNVEVYENEDGGLTAFYLDQDEGVVGMAECQRDEVDALAQDYAAVAVDGFDPCEWEEPRSDDEMQRAYRECCEEDVLIAAAGIGEYFDQIGQRRRTLGVRRDDCGLTGLLFALALEDGGEEYVS